MAQELRYANVIDVIYNKYPCVRESVDSAGTILATTAEACELVLRSAMWKNYLEKKGTKQTNALWKKYGATISQFGAIIPDTAEYLSRIGMVFNKFDQTGNATAEITADDKNAVLDMARSMKIAMRGSTRRIQPKQIFSLLNKINEVLGDKGFAVSAVTMLAVDPVLKETFRQFLHEYLQNTCYLAKEDIKMREDIKELMRLAREEDIFANMNISPDYINSLIDDNLAQAFPNLYKDSHGKFLDVPVGADLVPDGPVLWENRPEFPMYAMIWILRKSDYLVTNFISARQGFDTVRDVPDYDVYGQLICSNRNIRSGGMGKLLLVTTILMAYQYKVNYIFIQAFQGVTGVQAPLYNRMGFNFYFSDEVLTRKTGFYQWSLVDEDKLEKLHEQYLSKKLDKSHMPSKFQHLTFLQPMWLYVRGYETQYACDILEKSGFDYHTKSTGAMGQGVKKWVWDMPKRLLGYGQDLPKETQEAERIVEEFSRQADGADCKRDDECLSDYCLAGSCKPYPYETGMKKPAILKQLEAELRKKGIDTRADEALYKKRRIREQELLDEAAADEAIQEEIVHVKEEQDSLRAWYELVALKQKEGQLSAEEEKAFAKRLAEYKSKTSTGRYKQIAGLLLKGITDPIYEKLFGKK